MADAQRTIKIRFDGTTKGLERAAKAGGRAVERFRKVTDRFNLNAVKNFAKTSRTLDYFRGRVDNLIKPLGRLAASFAVFAQAALSVAGPLVKFLISAGKEIVAVTKAALAAAPALLSIGASLVFINLTLRQFGPAFTKAFEPLANRFKKAGEEAGRLAAKGIRPLAWEFRRLNMPAIERGMDRIAVATNGVVRSVLRWLNSRQGMHAIRTITEDTAEAFERLAPHVRRFVLSFLNMLNRISAVSSAAGANGLAGVLDYLSGRMSRVTAKSVRDALDKLKRTFQSIRDAVRDAVAWFNKASDFFEDNQAQIARLSDLVAVLAIAFGGLPLALAAATGLIIRHWDSIKAGYQGVLDYFTKNPIGKDLIRALKELGETVAPILDPLRGFIEDKVIPIWKELKDFVIKGITQGMDDLRVAFEDAKPELEILFDGLSDFGSFVRDKLVPIIGPLLQGVWRGLIGVLVLVVKTIETLVGAWLSVKETIAGATLGIAVGLELIVDATTQMVNSMLAGLLAIAESFDKTFHTDTASAVRAVQKNFKEMSRGAKAELNKIQADARQMAESVSRERAIINLKGNITDLERKVRDSKAALKGIKDKTVRIRASVDIAAAQVRLLTLKAQLAALGGARAAGGPVASGRTYLVGERGPELFTPTQSGNITPNHELGGGGMFEGTLYLDSGELLGLVRGEIRESNRRTKRAVLAGAGR